MGFILLPDIAFLVLFLFGSATAAIQEIAPNKMRAIFSAFFLFVVNIIGLGFGPLIVGFLNDSIFNDPNQIHYSIFIAQVIGCSLSALCLYLGLKPFIKSVDYLKILGSFKPKLIVLCCLIDGYVKKHGLLTIFR